jgi:hypothetical protein
MVAGGFMTLPVILFALSLPLAAQHPQMPAGMSHAEHLKQMQKDEALKKRGAAAMGFDQDATTHHFRIAPQGGSIEVTVRSAGDDQMLAAVRSHLRTIATQFAAGEFDKPLETHAEVPPGVAEMRKRKDRIAYRYEDLPQGGAVRMTTTDARALDAVHAFLRYQIAEHHTGDPLPPKR